MGNRRGTGRKVGPKTGNAPFSRQERGMARSHGGKTGGQAGGEGRVMRSLEARMRRPSFGINRPVVSVEGGGGEDGGKVRSGESAQWRVREENAATGGGL